MTPLKSKSHGNDSPQQLLWTKGDLGSEEPKLMGHHLKLFLNMKKPLLHPHKEQQESKAIKKMKINVQ
jgi:hypothetical protein